MVTFRFQETGPPAIRLNGRFTATNLGLVLDGPGPHLPLGNRGELSLERLLHPGSCWTAYGSGSASAVGGADALGRPQHFALSPFEQIQRRRARTDEFQRRLTEKRYSAYPSKEVR